MAMTSPEEGWTQVRGPYRGKKVFRGRKQAFEPRRTVLPDELIIMVLEEALIVHKGIEFCPEPFNWFPGTRFSNRSYQRSNGTISYPQNSRGFATAFQYQMDSVNMALSPFMSLFHVSRGFSSMALDILYGLNDFKFTNTAGWMGLDIWLHQIGDRNRKRLRSITVEHPEFSRLPVSLSQAPEFVKGIFGVCDEPAARVDGLFGRPDGLDYRTRWFDAIRVDRYRFRPFKQLQAVGTLTQLSIVFPDDVTSEDLVDLSALVSKAKFKNLKVTVVRKTAVPWSWGGGLSAKSIADCESLKQLDCSWKEIRIEPNGDYSVVPPRVAEPTGR